MKNQTKHRKLVLKKQSIAELSEKKMSVIRGGFEGCWENLWTGYHCDIVWSGGGERPDQDTAACYV